MIKYLPTENIEIFGYQPEFSFTAPKGVGPIIEDPQQPDVPESPHRPIMDSSHFQWKPKQDTTPDVPHEEIQKPDYSNALSTLRATLKSAEGLKLESYQDSGGIWTVGYGHTANVKPGQKITEQEANALLDKDIATHTKELQEKAEQLDLSESQFLALADYSFNLGPGALRKLLNESPDKESIRAKLAVRGLTDKKGNILPGLKKRIAKRLELWDS